MDCKWDKKLSHADNACQKAIKINLYGIYNQFLIGKRKIKQQPPIANTNISL